MIGVAARYRDRRAAVADAVLWALLSALVLLGSPIGPVALPWEWRVAALVPLAAAVVLVRALPPAALGAVAALSVLDAWFLPALFALSYLVGRHDARERRALYTFAGIVVAGTATLLVLPDAGTALRTVPLLTLSITPWLIGRHRRVQGDLVAAGWQRAVDLERRQREVAERARLRERWRIAQDMHDQLGHDLSLLAMRVGLLEVAGTRDDRVRELARELREVAQGAVERLHDVIGVLRADGGTDDGTDDVAARAPVPDDVATMVDAARRAGMAVELRRDGAEQPPEPVEQAVRLVVREALTNAGKHAPGARVRVRLRTAVDGTDVTVHTGAPPAGRPDRVRGSGSGLAALAEHTAGLGGAFDSGARDGGFVVRARFPRTGRDLPKAPPPGDAPARRSRGLAAAVVPPLAAVVVLLSLMMAYFADTTDDTVLAPGTFDGLALGQARADVAGLLPARQVAVTEVAGPPAPPGSRCEHYRTRDGDLFESDIPVHRLCFTDGRLVLKDAVSARLN
ncbi:sensor histidine kinase [Saccharothrix sp. Mg75]|uniref:sensor histidine kinase n=1 Tax=Saccharothrix sp. Mg75 TaxID=3445357 RepID=UPI003EE854C1